MILSVAMKILHTFYEKKLFKDENYFNNYGITWLIFECILLFIQPIYKAGDIRVSFLKEQYYDSNTLTFPEFTRDLNEYLIIIGITIHFTNFMVNVLSFTEWHSSRAYRICKKYRVSALDPFFVIKSYLNDNPLYFTFFLIITCSIYFSFIITVTENGYLRDIDRSLFATDADYDAEVNARSVFYSFNNIFWNVFITFTTIGYGDINVKATFSRFLIFFILCFGLVVSSIWVGVFLGFIELDTTDKLVYNNNEMVILGERIRVPAAKMIFRFYKMFKACENPKMYDFDLRKSFNCQTIRNSMKQEFNSESLITSEIYIRMILKETIIV
jgi:hypothetical protein